VLFRGLAAERFCFSNSLLVVFLISGVVRVSKLKVLKPLLNFF